MGALTAAEAAKLANLNPAKGKAKAGAMDAKKAPAKGKKAAAKGKMK